MDIISKLQSIGTTKEAAYSLFYIYESENKLEVLERYVAEKQAENHPTEKGQM